MSALTEDDVRRIVREEIAAYDKAVSCVVAPNSGSSLRDAVAAQAALVLKQEVELRDYSTKLRDGVSGGDNERFELCDASFNGSRPVLENIDSVPQPSVHEVRCCEGVALQDGAPSVGAPTVAEPPTTTG